MLAGVATVLVHINEPRVGTTDITMQGGASVHGIKHTLLPCPPEAFETLRRITTISPQATVSAALNCVIDGRDNMLKGWYCLLPPQTPASTVPFQPNIFEGGIFFVGCPTTHAQCLQVSDGLHV